LEDSFGITKNLKSFRFGMVNFFATFLSELFSELEMTRDESTGCRKINVFQVGGLVGKNLRNLEKIK
jgi:hypothetical protein